MKSLKTLCFSIVFTFFAGQLAQSQIEEHELDLLEETATVTFECNSCIEDNRFIITGAEQFKFKNVQFPFKQEMKLGDYQITFWKNGQPQTQVPFQINRNVENIVNVDAANGPF